MCSVGWGHQTSHSKSVAVASTCTWALQGQHGAPEKKGSFCEAKALTGQRPSPNTVHKEGPTESGSIHPASSSKNTEKKLVLSHKGKQRSGSLARIWNSLIAASRLAGEREMAELPAQGSNEITHYCRHGFEAPAFQDGVAHLHPIITS